MAGSYTNTDILMTNTGGLVVASNGDFQLTSIDQCQKQDSIIRTYTELGDFMALPELGSTIIQFIGEPNTASNAQALKAEILRALSADGRFMPSDLGVQIIPVAIDTIYAYISIQNAVSSTITQFMFPFSYITGLNISAIS